MSLTTGARTGGMGKIHLYSSNGVVMKRTLEFESKPFTNLIRRTYRLFRSLRHITRYRTTRKRPTIPTRRILESWRAVRRSKGYSERLSTARSGQTPVKKRRIIDIDQHPPIRRLTPKQKDTIALSYTNRSLALSGEPLKRKREEEDDPQVPETKRPRTDLPLWNRVRSKWTSSASLFTLVCPRQKRHCGRTRRNQSKHRMPGMRNRRDRHLGYRKMWPHYNYQYCREK